MSSGSTLCPECGADRSETICFKYNEHEDLAGAAYADLCCDCFDKRMDTEALDEDDDEG